METKNRSIKLAILSLVALLAVAGFVSSAGVSGPNWPGNPKLVYPGERGEVSLTIQNMVGGEDITFLVSLIQNDGEIVSVEEGEYEVPFGTKDTEVVLSYRIPDEAPIGTTYTVKMSFDTVLSGASSGAAIGTGYEITIPFEVQDIEPMESPPVISFGLILVVVVAALALVLAIVLVVKRRSAIQQMPQSALR